MGMVLVNLLPLMVGAAVLPLWIVLTLLLLRSDHGVLKGTALSAGAMLVRVLQGALFGQLLVLAGGPDNARSHQMASAVMLLTGIVLVATAILRWCIANDSGASLPAWMASLHRRITPFSAFGMGFVLMAIALKQWIFTLSALAVIEEAELGKVRSTIAYLIFVVAAQLLVLSPVIISAVSPGHATRILDAAQRWLTRNNRVVTIIVSLSLGLWLFYKGMNGFLYQPEPPPATESLQ